LDDSHIADVYKVNIMNRIFILLFCVVFFCSFQEPKVEKYTIIPYPQQVVYATGSYKLCNTPIVCYTKGLKNEASMLQSFLKEDYSIQSVVCRTSKKGNIFLIMDPTILPDKKEGYKLIVDKNRIEIRANSANGISNGVQTLRQIIREDQGEYIIQQATINDYPSFSWRAFMLDEGRYFKGKKVVLRLLDEMARLKMNVFHWHLTDDQGWRIEIKKYPKLTEIGAYRDSSEIDHWYSNVFDGKPHSGYYTQKDIKEIVDYAAKRYITIVPEIEMPGHSSAAIASYSWLGTIGKPIKVLCRFGTESDVYNVADPRVIQFLKDVLDETISLFPSKIIHIGGDEVRYDMWRSSPSIMQYISSNKLNSAAELQVYFTRMIANYIASKNCRMMGWSDITGDQLDSVDLKANVNINQKLPMTTIVQFWKGDLKLIKLAIDKGYDIVNSYSQGTYLDYGFPLSKAYSFNPIPEGLSEKEKAKILGLGCQMWGEMIPTEESMDKKVFPRIAAYAEIGWTSNEKKNYDRFVQCLQPWLTRWKNLEITYGKVDN